MNVLIRADSSLLTGVGHISRTLCLAERLRARGSAATFVCRDLPGNMSHLISQRDFALCMLPGELPEGPDEVADARACAAILDALQPEWLVVDHYGLGALWESAGRASGRQVLAIDDLANRRHDCDVILDQNLYFDGSMRYGALVPVHCEQLVGPQYALLNSDYAEHARRSRRELLNVLVYFGGGNTTPAILKAVAALSTEQNLALAVTVVANPRMQGFDSVVEACRRRPHTDLQPPRHSLAALMAEADLAIGGGGVTTWERMCLGLPAITAVMADNQRVLAAQLAQRGLTVSLGEVQDFTVKALVDAINAMRSPGALETISTAVHSICDGRGAERVAAVMTDRA